ncbi:MAG: SAM-dependent chlorinase/fluorinase [Thiohalocapsa sp.]
MKLNTWPRRIALVTDFGEGPYTGQMLLTLSALTDCPVVSLVSNLAPWRPDLAAYLLPGLMQRMPSQTLYLCVVDPGVGGPREALAVQVGSDWLVGPDNGLFVPSIRREPRSLVHRVRWRPEILSDSFHGRDLFAPIAAAIAAGELPDAGEVLLDALSGTDWPAALNKVCYVDAYGNLITGLKADAIPRDTRVRIGGRQIGFARTFCEVPRDTPFWYANAFGLVEVAANQARADELLGVGAGDALTLLPH